MAVGRPRVPTSLAQGKNQANNPKPPLQTPLRICPRSGPAGLLASELSFLWDGFFLFRCPVRTSRSGRVLGLRFPRVAPPTLLSRPRRVASLPLLAGNANAPDRPKQASCLGRLRSLPRRSRSGRGLASRTGTYFKFAPRQGKLNSLREQHLNPVSMMAVNVRGRQYRVLALLNCFATSGATTIPPVAIRPAARNRR